VIARNEIGFLLVEPSDTYQRILEALLRKLGFQQIQRVGNTLKARVLLEHDKNINVVIAELMNPGPEEGLAFVREVRRKYPADELPVLLMTNLSEREYVERAVQAGVNGYLIKPVNPDHLETHLWRLFDLPLRGQRRIGEYLVQNGLVTTEQRDLALEFQKEYSTEHHSCAVIALYLGYLNEKQLVQTVFTHQLDDEGLFAWAEPLGLTDEQVNHLRAIKESYRLRIGDIMVKLGFVKEEEVERALRHLGK
jgi:two-component system chemotaxis response regulator CheY